MQASGLIELGTPGDPTLYTTRLVHGPTTWQALALSFVATDATLRLSLLGQAAVAGATIEYDGIRFLPAGRNPVRVMAAVFAQFLPHLTLSAESVETAATRRDGWLFSGYVPEPGRTDALLTKMSQECFCTLYKDVAGVYQIVADDYDMPVALRLDSDRDVHQGSTGLAWGNPQEVYSDFYLWYQRVSTQVTTNQAGQYAAVLYVTPDDSISLNPDLQTLCAQAQASLGTRRRFDYYADFIADPVTADLLLTRLVQQFTLLAQALTVEASLAAVPLEVTDRVVREDGPASGRNRLWAKCARRRSPPACKRQGWPWDSRCVRWAGRAACGKRGTVGAWRGCWRRPAGVRLPGTTGPPGTLRVREQWEEEGPGPPEETDGNVFPFAAWIGALHHVLLPGEGMVAATQVRTGDPLPTAAPLWQVSTAAPADAGPWTSLPTVAGGGQGTALGPMDFGSRLAGAIRATVVTPLSSLWQLGGDAGQPIAPLVALPDGVVVTSTWDAGDTLLLGTADGAIYLWAVGSADVTQVLATGGGRVQILQGVLEGIEAWIESPSGLVIRRATSPAGPWTPYTYTSVTGTRCSTALVSYASGTILAVATGTEAGDRIDIWNLAFETTTGAILLHTFLCGPAYGVPLQRPWALCEGPAATAASHPLSLYLGRVSLDSTPFLELWEFNYTLNLPPDDLDWQLARDFAAVPDAIHGLDTNQGITALDVSPVSHVLYVATGTPGGTAPFPGARIHRYVPS